MTSSFYLRLLELSISTGSSTNCIDCCLFCSSSVSFSFLASGVSLASFFMSCSSGLTSISAKFSDSTLISCFFSDFGS